MIAGRPLDVAISRAPTRRVPLASLARPTAIVILTAMIATPVLLQPWVSSDGIGHYAYLRSMMFDHDLDFANEYAHYQSLFRRNGPPSVDEAETPPSQHVSLNPIIEKAERTATGRVWDPWPVGSSMMWAPFALAVWPVVAVLRALGMAIPNDGYSTPYMLAVGLGSVVYGVLGLILALRLCTRYFGAFPSLLALFATWFGTSFVFYLFVMPSYAHANAMFTATWFVWYWHRWFHDPARRPTARAAFVLGLIGGIMSAVQWTNATFLATFGAVTAWELWTQSRRSLGPVLQFGVLVGLGWLVGFSPQLAANHVLFGSVLADPQPVGFFHWTNPHLLGVLFSSDRGLFFWTPLVMVCLAGLVFCPKPARLLAGLLLLNFALHLYINASVETWTGDSAFGQRRFVNLTLLFMFGLSAFIERLETARAPWIRRLRLVLPGLLVAWNLLLIVQYVLWIVPHTGQFTVADLVGGQVRALREIGTIVRFLL